MIVGLTAVLEAKVSLSDLSNRACVQVPHSTHSCPLPKSSARNRGGRHGSCRCLDMHQAIGAALHVFEQQIVPHFTTGMALKP
jgi:hypothetical protein